MPELKIKAETFNSTTAGFIENLGSAVCSLINAVRYIYRLQIENNEFIRKFIFIGLESLIMVLLLSSIASMILTMNTGHELIKYGGRELIGSLTMVANVREILPVFMAFAFAARCGTAITAEISTMKITEQIDVLRVLKVDPIYFFLAPTILATLCVVPLVESLSMIVSNMAGMFIAKIQLNLEFEEFMDSAWKAIEIKDYVFSLIKAEIFSVYAMLMSVNMGLNCRGGAKEVGLTTTKSSAYLIVGIIILDGILTPALFGGLH